MHFLVLLNVLEILQVQNIFPVINEQALYLWCWNGTIWTMPKHLQFDSLKGFREDLKCITSCLYICTILLSTIPVMYANNQYMYTH